MNTQYDETNVPGPEFRVRPVVRYVVTRYCHPYESRDGTHGSPGGSTTIGEFDNEQHAWDVSVALAAAELKTVEAQRNPQEAMSQRLEMRLCRAD